MAHLSKKELGDRGEEIAVRRLESLGYTVLTRNYRTPYGEIDCVAQDGETVVFVEVKTRSSARFGSPQEAVTPQKQARLCRSAMVYLQTHGLSDSPCRFDVLAIRVGRGNPDFRLLKNAFTCEGVET